MPNQAAEAQLHLFFKLRLPPMSGFYLDVSSNPSKSDSEQLFVPRQFNWDHYFMCVMYAFSQPVKQEAKKGCVQGLTAARPAGKPETRKSTFC